MNKLTTKRLLPFLLAMVMIFGTISPAFAAGFDGSNEPVQKTESELISKNGKLRAKLVVPQEPKVQKRFMVPFGGPAKAPKKAPAKAPGFGETTVKVNIVKHGIGTNPFNFDAVFGTTPDTKVTLINWDTDETQEATFNKDTQSVTFDKSVSMEDMTNDVYGIEFEGTNVAGKITFYESTPSYSGGSNITTFTLDLYQVRNTDVIVKTVDAEGTEATNPTTAATGGKIKLTAGNVTETIDIPAVASATETVKNINTRNKNDINNGLNFTVEGLENGVLVDKDANKVYKPTIVTPDPDGLKPTEIKFTEKPIVTETEPKIDDPENPGTQITDPDYVKVTFAKGDHGTISENKTYYVFKDVEMGKTLTAPTVTPNKDWKFTTWDPALATKYDEGKTHVAQYQYTGEDVVPQKPGEDKPDVPSDFVLVEFKPGAHGTLSGTTKYWVNPEAGKTLANIDKPTVTANDGYKHTGWDKADTTAITEALKVTAEYKAKVVTENPNDEAYVKVDFAAGAHGTIAEDATKEYWVLKNEEVTLAAPTVTANEGWTQKTGAEAWDKPLTASYTTDTTITAQYTYNGNDVVPQPGDDKPNVPDNFVLVEFKAGDHGTLEGTTKYWVNPDAGKTLENIDKPTVTPEGNWTHTGWDKADTTAITEALKVTAEYKAKVVTENPNDEAYVKVDFAAGAHGTIAADATKEYWVLKNEEVTLAAPTVTANEGWTQKTGAEAWDKPLTASYTTDTTITAQYTYNGNDVVPQPGDDKPNVPDNFVLVEFKAGDHGTLEGTTKYWVNPDAGKTLENIDKPTVTPEGNWTHTGWDKADTTAITEALKVTAEYKAKVVTENPNDEAYVKVDFAAGAHGTIAADATKEYWVLKNEEVTLAAPEVTANEGWTQKTGAEAWDKPLTASYTTDTTITAQYTYNGNDVVPQPGDDKPNVPDNFVLVEFKAGDHGTLEGTTKYWVNPDAGKTLENIDKPTVTPEGNWTHTGWDKADTTAITEALKVTAEYKAKVVTTDPNDSENYAHVTFTTTKGTVTGQAEYWVLKNEKVTFTTPTVDLTGVEGYTFKAWDPAVAESYSADTVHNATFNYTGNDIVPQPGEEKPDVPADFVLVEFKAGEHGTIAETETTKYWVNPDAGKTLENIDKPTVTPEGNWTHTGWDKADTTAITEALKVTAQYTQNPSIVANPVQKYDEATDNQYIEGVLPEGKTLPADAKVELVVKNGDNYEKVDVPVTTDGGVIKVNVKDDNIQHGETYYFAITEEGKTTSYSEIPVKVDKQGPTLGTPGNEITLAPDAYGYQVKVSANASDDSGILRVYAEKDKSADNSYYDEDASKTTANLSESIQNQLGVEKEFTVTAVDKFGNKTEVKKTAEATGTPIMIKAERPLDGDDFIYVTTDEGANLEITVINQDKTTAFTMTHIQGQPSEEIKLVGTDGAFKLTKEQRVKVKGSLEGKEDNTLTIRVR